MRQVVPALLLCVASACAPQGPGSQLPVTVSQVAVRTVGNIEPGAYVHIWRSCPGPSTRCHDSEIARGVVTAVLIGPPEFAFVAVAPGTQIREGDRAVEDDPMYYWHPGDHPPM